MELEPYGWVGLESPGFRSLESVAGEAEGLPEAGGSQPSLMEVGPNLARPGGWGRELLQTSWQGG